MTAGEKPWVSAYFPLWGATFDSDDVGLVGPDIAAYIPEPQQWHAAQKHDVWLHHWRETRDKRQGPPVPLCLVSHEDLDDGEEPDQRAIERRLPAMTEAARRGVLALRLHKPGWFLDPALAERAFVCGMARFRMPGPYRQAFVDGAPPDIPPGYDLHLAELTFPPGPAGPVEALSLLLDTYYASRPHSSAEIAADNFSRSYGYQLNGSQRAALLFTAVEAMLGAPHDRKIGDTTLTSTWQARVRAAFVQIAAAAPYAALWAGFDPGSEAAWLAGQAREMRNNIAHGYAQAAEARARAAHDRLQGLVRLLLRQYLAFSVRWAARPDKIRTGLRLPPGRTPAEAYNRYLDFYARGLVDGAEIHPAPRQGPARAADVREPQDAGNRVSGG